jgi:hypothetical protein
MRLLLDEQLSEVIALELRPRHHDVVTVADAGLTGWPDPEVLAWAAAAQRALVTGNIQDFRPLHAAHLSSGDQHFGIVLVPHGQRREDLGSIVRALDALLVAHRSRGALRDREWLL